MINTTVRAVCAATLFTLCTMAWAPSAGAVDARAGIGPKVGDEMPHGLEVPDHGGKPRSFADLAGEHGLVLIFNRSLSWCPYCQADARRWNDSADKITGAGWGLTLLTYDSVDKLAGFAHRFGFRFPLLSDSGSKVIRAFGVLNKDHAPGSFAHGVPHPMVFVIAKDRTVRARFSEVAYSNRISPDVVLETLKSLSD